MITPRTALAGGGGILAVIAFVLGGAVGDSADFVSPPPAPAAVVVVAPASPGLTSAEVICARGFPQPLNDGGYRLIFGLDVIEASPELAQGFPLILVNGEPVSVSEEVRECILRRFR